MITFNPINREYINPADLNTLNKTYNTLEQGHKEAVKTASELEIAIANLPIHSSEAGWRQGKLNEITKTVEDHTLYGNAYGALDDLIIKQGDLLSDGGTLGRIKSNQAYEEYQKQLTNRTDISEGMKEMYREENPYHYEDGPIDEKSGRVIEGKTWEPNSRPVSTVDFFKVMSAGLSIAAKESGGGNSVMFLDENGNPTADPRKSVDGAMYTNTSSKWERLSDAKIRQAIDAAIKNTPGAIDSLRQDYKYDMWKLNKNKKIENNNSLVDPNITDENGLILPFDGWLSKKINPFVDASKYNNVFTSIEYGSALANRNAKIASARSGNGGSDIVIPGREGIFLGADNAGTIEVEQDNYGNTLTNRNSAHKTLFRLLGKYAPGFANSNRSISRMAAALNIKGSGPGEQVNGIMRAFKSWGINISDTDKEAIFNATKAYANYNATFNRIRQIAGVDRDALDFSNNISTQEYSSNNKYGRSINNYRNQLFANENNTVSYSIGDLIARNLAQQYGVTNINDIEGLNVSKDGDNYIVTFNKQNSNLLPTFNNRIRKADNDISGNLFTGIKRKFFNINSRSNYTVNYSEDNKIGNGISTINNLLSLKNGFNPITNIVNYGIKNQHDGLNTANYLDFISNSVNPANKTFPSIQHTVNNYLNRMDAVYNRGLDRASQAQLKTGAKTRGIISAITTDRSTLGECWATEEYRSNPNMTLEDYKNLSKIYKDNLDNSMANSNFSAGRILVSEDKGMNYNENIGENQNYTDLISYMYRNHSDKVSRTVDPDGLGMFNQPVYHVKFTVPKGENVAVASKYKGKTFDFLLTGSLEEDVSQIYNPSSSSRAIATNNVDVAHATKTSVNIINYNRYLGDTNVNTNPNGSMTINFAGSQAIVDKNGATDFTDVMLQLQGIRDRVEYGMIDLNNNTHKVFVANSIQTLANSISNLTGKDYNTACRQLANYIYYGEE